MLGKLSDKWLKKRWPTENVHKYIGDYQDTFISYAPDANQREVYFWWQNTV